MTDDTNTDTVTISYNTGTDATSAVFDVDPDGDYEDTDWAAILRKLREDAND